MNLGTESNRFQTYTYRIYTPIFFKWPSMTTWYKNLYEIGAMVHLLRKQMAVNVGKLISFGNILVREITCLVTPTTPAPLVLSYAK